MILDKEVLFADKIDFDGVPATIDLGAVRPGPGEPIKVFFTTHTLFVAADEGISFLDAVVAPADEDLMNIGGALPLAGETIEFELPSDTKQFVTLAITGSVAVTAGNYSCGIVLPGVQTNT